MHPVQLFGRFLAVLLGLLLGVGRPVEEGILGIRPELVPADLLDREGRPAKELRILVGLADDDLYGAALTGRDRSRIAVAALEELDEAASQGVLQVAERDAACRLDVQGVAGYDQLDRVATGDLAAGISIGMDVERRHRRLAGLLDEGVAYLTRA